MGRVRPVVRSAIHDSDDGPRFAYLVRNRPNAEYVLRRLALHMWSGYEEPFGLTLGDSATFRLTVRKGDPAIQSFLGWGS